MSKYKIVHVITGLNVGGAEMMLYKLLSKINSAKFDSFVMSLKGGTLSDQMETLGIPVYSANVKFDLNSVTSFYQLLKKIKNLNPDLIQGWMYHGNLVAQISGIFVKRNTPILWNIRGSHYDLSNEKKLTALAIWLNGKLSNYPTKIINNSIKSAQLHEDYLGYNPEKKTIIPNGFDTEIYKPIDNAGNKLRSELPLPDDSVLIGMIGRYHPVKDHDNMLNAASLLTKKNLNVCFILIGRDVDNNNLVLREQLRRLGLTKCVYLLGERSDIPKIVSALDIVVSSSYSEGFPNVIGEAMACAVPCIVTDVGDSAWIVGDTGLVVPPRDSLALANAIEKMLMLDRKGRELLGISARKRIIEKFSINSIVKQYENLYLETIHQKQLLGVV